MTPEEEKAMMDSIRPNQIWKWKGIRQPDRHMRIMHITPSGSIGAQTCDVNGVLTGNYSTPSRSYIVKRYELVVADCGDDVLFGGKYAVKSS